MNIYSAIRSLSNGRAVKPSTWRGYVERIDKTLSDNAYTAQRTYDIGDKVVYNGSRYLCTTAVTAPEEFDLSKWSRIDSDRYIVFVDAEDGDPYSVTSTPNPSAVYFAEVQDADNTVKYTRIASTGDMPVAVPDEIGAVHPAWSGASLSIPVDMPDSELFNALMSDTWEAGLAKDYEEQRSVTGRRW